MPLLLVSNAVRANDSNWDICHNLMNNQYPYAACIGLLLPYIVLLLYCCATQVSQGQHLRLHLPGECVAILHASLFVI